MPDEIIIEKPGIIPAVQSALLHWLLVNYSQSTSHVTSIFENEMNTQIPLCNVRHLNGMLNISLEIFLKKTQRF